jgi:predicted nucleic acid-binding protein
MELKQITAKKAYFDTNLFIYLIEKHPVHQKKVTALIQHLDAIGCQIITSELTLAECLVKPYADQDTHSQKKYMQGIQSSPFLEVKPVSKNILVRSAQLRAELKNKLPDSIHLATAFEHGCSVFIGNDKSIKTNSNLPLYLLSE